MTLGTQEGPGVPAMVALATLLVFPAVGRGDVPLGPRTPGDVSPLPVLGQAPAFHLRSLEGPGVRNRDLGGKLVLLAFVCASCADEPEAVAATFARLQGALKARGLFGKKVVLAFVVRHPERESRTGFRAYASRYSVDPYGWVILSGPPETTARLREQFGRFGVADGKLPAETRGRIFLLDSSGRVRRVYTIETFQADAVLADLDRLL